MKLLIFKEVAVRLPRNKLYRLFSAVTESERRGGWASSVNLIFTGDGTIRGLNRQYRHKDRPTDVLSFNLEDSRKPDDVFGEIYISVPTATRQARQYGGTVADEILRLACHGLLHLLGYDHMSDKEEKVMKKQEEKYLSKVSGR